MYDSEKLLLRLLFPFTEHISLDRYLASCLLNPLHSIESHRKPLPISFSSITSSHPPPPIAPIYPDAPLPPYHRALLGLLWWFMHFLPGMSLHYTSSPERQRRQPARKAPAPPTPIYCACASTVPLALPPSRQLHSRLWGWRRRCIWVPVFASSGVALEGKRERERERERGRERERERERGVGEGIQRSASSVECKTHARTRARQTNGLIGAHARARAIGRLRAQVDHSCS